MQVSDISGQESFLNLWHWHERRVTLLKPVNFDEDFETRKKSIRKMHKIHELTTTEKDNFKLPWTDKRI